MDIGFSGGPTEADNANLAAFVGGTQNDFNKVRSLLFRLCNKHKINYVGKNGTGHFSKVIVHNTIEYGIMGVLGEIESLSNKIGDPKRVMRAVNNGLAETRLGALYQPRDEQIENTGCRIDVTQNAAKLALREAKVHNVGLPMTAMVYHLIIISGELYKSNSISERKIS